MNAAILEVLLKQQIFKKRLNRFSCELEVLVLWVSQDVVKKTSEGDNQLASKTSDNNDSVLLRLLLPDIVDLDCSRIEFFERRVSKSLRMNLIEELANPVSLSGGVSLLLSLPLLLFPFLLLTQLLLFVLLSALILLDHCISVHARLRSHAEVE